MSLGITIAAAALASLQDGATAPAAADEGWKALDRVVIIVNDEILTQRDIGRELWLIDKRQGLNDDEARVEEKRIRARRVREMIRVQAGQDMGLPAAQVERSARDYIERDLDRFGSSQEKARHLQEMDMTFREREEQVKDAFYARAWDNYVTGEGAVAADGRPSRDRFVRPGYLGFAWNTFVERPELMPRIGGKPQTVVLHYVLVDPRAVGGEEQGRALALQIRQRVVEGEDMRDVVEKQGGGALRQTLTEPLEEVPLARLYPEIGRFLADAKPGDLSDVLSYRGKDRDLLQIVRLVERTAAVAPDFGSAEVQQRIADRVRDDLAEWRLEMAYRIVLRDSYVWPSEPGPR